MTNRLVHYDGRRPQAHVANLVVDTSNSHVGIGTTNPLRPLHITDRSNAHTDKVRSTTLLALERNPLPLNTANNYQYSTVISFRNPTFAGNTVIGSNNFTETSAIQHTVLNSNVDTDGGVKSSLIFFTKENNDLDSRISIVGSNVGVGTDTPIAKLHVEGNIYVTSNVTFTDPLAIQRPTGNVLVHTDTGEVITSNAMNFDQGNVNATNVTVTTLGFDGGGGSGPVSSLTLQDVTEQGASTDRTVTFSNATTAFTTTANVVIGSTCTINDSGTAVTISRGSSGVSVDASANELFIEDDVNCGLTIACPESSVGSIHFSNPSAPLAGRIRYNHASNAMIFDTNNENSGWLFLDKQGQLGVNQSAPEHALHVGNDVLVANTTTSNVGLSNIAPTKTLHINGDMVVGTGANDKHIIQANRFLSVVGPDGTTSLARMDATNADSAIEFAVNNSSLWRIGNRGQGGEDQFRIADGSSLGDSATRLTIDNTGYVGIGNVAPASPLTVEYSGAGTSTIRVDSDENAILATRYRNGIGANDGCEVIIQTSNTNVGVLDVGQLKTGDAVGDIQWKGGSDSNTYQPMGRIKVVAKTDVTPSDAASEMRFYTTNNSEGNVTQRMVIDENGRVGIGTSSPSTILHSNIGGSSTLEQDIARFSSVTTGGNLRFLDISSNNAGGYVAFDVSGSSSGNYIFRRGGTERMRLTGTGLGIGVVDPNLIFPLQVTTNTGTPPQALQLNTTDWTTSVGSSFQFGFGAATGDTYSEIRALQGGYNYWSNLVMQLNGGSVGIGAVPKHRFHVNTGTSGAKVDVLNQPDGSIVFENGSGGTAVPNIVSKSTTNTGLVIVCSTPEIAASKEDFQFNVVNNSGTAHSNVDSLNKAYSFKVGGTRKLTILRNGDVDTTDRLALRQTRYGYSTSYKVVQYGECASESSISLGYDPIGNGGSQFSGNEILIPYNKAIIAPTSDDTGYVGILRLASSNILQIGGSSYTTAGHIKIDEASGTVAIATTTSNIDTAYALHVTRAGGSSGNILIEGDSSFSGNPKIRFTDANSTNTGVLDFNDESNKFTLNKGLYVNIDKNTYSAARIGNTSNNLSMIFDCFDTAATNGLASLIPSGRSRFGGIISGGANGHLILNIRNNDQPDAVIITSNTQASGTNDGEKLIDRCIATFEAGGKIGFHTITPTGEIDIRSRDNRIDPNTNSFNSQPTYKGYLRIGIGENQYDEQFAGGIEFVNADSAAGYGWRIMQTDNGSGDVPLIFQNRNNNVLWTNRFTFFANGNFTATGTKSFLIDHPLDPSKKLKYFCPESPTSDLNYRGKVQLVNGQATVNIDSHYDMMEGTFEAITNNIQVFTTNESGWDAVKGSVSGNILTITCINNQSTDEISWLVIGSRIFEE